MGRQKQPQKGEDVITLVEEGKLTAGEALALLRSNSPQSAGSCEAEAQREQRLAVIKRELDSMIGLATVKKLVWEIQAYVEIQQRRQALQLLSEPVVLHMIFSGNPGSGKTTVARIIGQLFREVGVLSKGHLHEVERADLVAEYIGQTAQRTREQLRKSLGGILFIDEAYSLARGGEKDFGKESIDTMVKVMEDCRSDLIVILAGYSEPMEEFLETNPGLKSRFPISIDFPDYSSAELFKIAEGMLRQRQYRLDPKARKLLYRAIEQRRQEDQENFGNARVVRNMIEKAVRCQAVRLVTQQSCSRQELMEISAADIQGVFDA